MSENTVTVPAGLWDKFVAWFDRRASEPEPEAPPPAVEPEQFTALQAERDQFRAELETLKAEAAQKARVDAFAAQLAETKAEPKAEMLAGMTDEQAAWVLVQFKALSAQINESALTGEIGNEGKGLPADPVAAFDQAVKAYAVENKVDYAVALRVVATEQPELYRAYAEK